MAYYMYVFVVKCASENISSMTFTFLCTMHGICLAQEAIDLLMQYDEVHNKADVMSKQAITNCKLPIRHQL